MRIWLDNDANGTLDAGDDVQVDDDFSSATLALTYAAAGTSHSTPLPRSGSIHEGNSMGL